MIIYEGKDNFDDEDEKGKVFISRWAREKQGRHIFICEKLLTLLKLLSVQNQYYLFSGVMCNSVFCTLRRQSLDHHWWR